MGSGKSKMQKNSTTNERAVSDCKITPDEEENNKMEIIHSLLDCNEIDFSDSRYHTLTQADVESTLSRCGMNLHELILDENCDSTIMATVKKFCQNLEQFEFCLSKINEDDFIDVFTDMTRLKSLTVRSDSESGEERENPVDITKILNSVRDDISEIFLLTHKNTVFSSACLHIFPSTLGRLTKLRHLILQEFDIDNNAVMEISKIKSLTKLELIICKIGEGTSFILNLPELESLTLRAMENIDDCIINLSNESKNLKLLDIKYCSTEFSDALKKISNLINLEELNLEQCEEVDSDVFASIVNGCAKLKNLYIPKSVKISGDALVKISNLKNLEVLDICETKNVNDDVIIEIANNCKKITELHIDSCNNVSSLALNELAKLENLEVLQLVDVDNAGDDIFKNMYKLKKLKCTWCRNVTDSGIMRIIKNASNLDYLMLYRTGVTKICLVDVNDVGDEIFNNMSQLRVLKCNWCFNVTDVGIMKIIKNSPNLKTLMLCRTGITRQTLACAAKSTKKRINNIQLEVITDQKICEAYERLDHYLGPLISFKGLDLYSRN
ncbi:hypothetical protein HCN44_001473 [Aphidius gifuensis]|uniref:F-box/LRR-repeat protein 15-like leucin rich repeat domain-containing protein n=1 Tax=Aphidius gifuensis TaxID=684658 RepID=A0A835CSD1_APHGI|nr:hypothetical protein HCN44_001473 [Aphidius gifuensis]